VFIAPSCIVDVDGLGKYQIRLTPEMKFQNRPEVPILMVSPVDSSLSMVWEREELVMDRPFWAGAFVAVTEEGLQVLASAIQPGSPEAKTFFTLEADYIRHLWTARAKQAVTHAMNDNVLPQFESLFQPLKEIINAPM
jgi:hypothetical protein